jgi:hypothetical protein
MSASRHSVGSFWAAVALLGGVGACGSSRAPGAVQADGAPDAGVADTGAPDIGVAEAGAPEGGAPDAQAPRSAGCGVSPNQELEKYVQYNLVVPDVPAAYAATYTNRVYWVRLPAGYDPARAYPTAFLGPGCGTSGQAPIPLQLASMGDAILVGLNGINDCFNHDAADSPDLAYFDETLKHVEADFCVDPGRIFVAGFSSGAWLTTSLGCARAGIIRGQASVAGGLPPVPACTGPIAAMYVADTDDNKNAVAGVTLAVERVRVVNGCSNETEPYDFGVPSPCLQYKGCMPGYPLVICVTSGVGHADQSSTRISTVGFWHFWSSLP